MTLLPFTVEDGTGVENATSYVTVDESDTFAANIGNTEWVALDSSVKEPLLSEASRTVDREFGSGLTGRIASSDQGLQAPRLCWGPRPSASSITYWDGIPTLWKEIVITYAILSNMGLVDFGFDLGSTSGWSTDVAAIRRMRFTDGNTIEYADTAVVGDSTLERFRLRHAELARRVTLDLQASGMWRRMVLGEVG